MNQYLTLLILHILLIITFSLPFPHLEFFTLSVSPTLNKVKTWQRPLLFVVLSSRRTRFGRINPKIDLYYMTEATQYLAMPVEYDNNSDDSVEAQLCWKPNKICNSYKAYVNKEIYKIYIINNRRKIITAFHFLKRISLNSL